jgi:hypothetical protein
MTFVEMITKYPGYFRLSFFNRVNLERVADLLDRGDTAEIGRIIGHELDIAKHALETEPLTAVDDDLPSMMQRQAD